VSFVNAPGVPDPNIAFDVERDQIKPVVVEEPVLLGADLPVGAP
jgi:nitrite reductase (NADH) large subunit